MRGAVLGRLEVVSGGRERGQRAGLKEGCVEASAAGCLQSLDACLEMPKEQLDARQGGVAAVAEFWLQGWPLAMLARGLSLCYP